MTSQFDLDAHLTSPLRIVGDEAVVSPAPVVVLLTCYMTGSTEGRNLGIAGYSHDFVAKAFAPLLGRYGEVREVVDPQRNLQQEVDRLIAAQRRPVHFSVLPLQDVVLGERVANIAVPAWEFPDAPNEGFDGNPQNDWGATADSCDLVLVSGRFTKAAQAGSGTTTAIGVVPVPVDDSYFAVPEWNPEHAVTLECRGYAFGPDNNLRVADSESSQNPDLVRRVIEFYRGRDVRHRCRLVFICDFLTEAQLLELTTGTTFYLQATKAGGNCVPLMNHLAAGRPGVSPPHSSVGDYFDAQSGSVVASHGRLTRRSEPLISGPMIVEEPVPALSMHRTLRPGSRRLSAAMNSKPSPSHQPRPGKKPYAEQPEHARFGHGRNHLSDP